MEKAFVTGAAGFIGNRLSLALAQSGVAVHALVRNPVAASQLQHPNITIFKGDLLNVSAIQEAMEGCQQVYHLGALAKMWVKDNHDYELVNVTGTQNVLSAALQFKVKKMIYVSTAGMLPPSENSVTNELSERRPELYTGYERSKAAGEDICIEFLKKGLPVVILYPTNVFGPGPIDDCNSSTLMMRNFISGKWRFIPGNGKGVMNYVFIDDTVNGIISAMQHAAPGTRYIIGGENASYDIFFEMLRKATGVDRRLYHIPYRLIRAVAWLETKRGRLLKIRPFVTTEWVKKLPYKWSKDIDMARKDLNYDPITLEEGIRLTTAWLYNTGQTKQS